MPQNINLLEELTVKPYSAFNSKLMVQIVGTWILLLIFIYFLAYGIYSMRQKTITNLETIQKTLLEKIETYKQNFPGLEKGKTGEAKTTPAYLNPGFYRYLKDLATLAPHGLWLTEIVISEPNNLAILKGSTITASGISALIESLSQSENFKNKKFNTIQLYENIETYNTDFTISTANPSQPLEPTKKNESSNY